MIGVCVPRVYGQSSDEKWEVYLGEYAKGLDSTQFNYQLLAEQWLNDSPDTITKKLGEILSPHLYSGVLRGANGTLTAGAGNAWDQAILLGNILKLHGYDVRLARTKIKGKNLQALLEATRASSWRNPVKNRQKIKKAIGHLNSTLGNTDLTNDLINFTIKSSRYNGNSGNLIPSLRDTLSREVEKSIAGDSERKKLIRKWAEDYVWVQLRKKPGAKWQNLHTIFLPADELTPESFFDLKVDNKVRHSLSIRLFASYMKGEREERKTLTPKHDIDLFFNQKYPTVITLIGDSYLTKPEKRKDFISSFYYLPAINGRSPQYSYAIKSDGKTIAASNLLLANPQLRFSETISGVLGEMSKQLATKEESKTIFNGIWLEVNYKPPFAAKTKRTTRLLVDAATLIKSEQDRAVPFLGSWTLFSFNSTRNSADFLTTLLTTVADNSNGKQVPLRNPIESATTSKHFLGLSGAYEEKHFLAYQHEPFIGLSSLLYGPGDMVHAGFDIMQSGTVALSRKKKGLCIDPKQTMALGIYQSIREGQMLDRLRYIRVFANRVSTIKTLSKVKNYSLVTSERKLPASIGEKKAIRSRAVNDITSGHLLLLPQTGEGWWRINTTTGNTISVDGYGRGGESLEYLITLEVARVAMMAKTVSGFLGNIMNCTTECCVKTTTGFALFGQILGDMMGMYGGATDKFIRSLMVDQGNSLIEDAYRAQGGC